jgi:hypothetical protein
MWQGRAYLHESRKSGQTGSAGGSNRVTHGLRFTSRLLLAYSCTERTVSTDELLAGCRSGQCWYRPLGRPMSNVLERLRRLDVDERIRSPLLERKRWLRSALARPMTHLP